MSDSLNVTSFAEQGRTVDGNYLDWHDQNGKVNAVKLQAMWQGVAKSIGDIRTLEARIATLEEELKCLKTKPEASSSGKKEKPGPSSGNPTRRRVPSKT